MGIMVRLGEAPDPRLPHGRRLVGATNQEKAHAQLSHSPPHFRDGGRARRAHGARPAGIGPRDGKPDGKPGRLSRYRADARIGAELLQAITGHRARRRVGGNEGLPAQSENTAQRQDQGADRAGGSGSESRANTASTSTPPPPRRTVRPTRKSGRRSPWRRSCDIGAPCSTACRSTSAASSGRPTPCLGAAADKAKAASHSQ